MANQIHNELEGVKGKNDDISLYIENSLKADLNRVLADEELYWKQRSKIFWLKKGIKA